MHLRAVHSEGLRDNVWVIAPKRRNLQEEQREKGKAHQGENKVQVWLSPKRRFLLASKTHSAIAVLWDTEIHCKKCCWHFLLWRLQEFIKPSLWRSLKSSSGYTYVTWNSVTFRENQAVSWKGLEHFLHPTALGQTGWYNWNATSPDSSKKK